LPESSRRASIIIPHRMPVCAAVQQRLVSF
jgi:hypothetical protein